MSSYITASVDVKSKKEGWLSKHCGNVLKTWKRRFFVLHGNGKLSYYQSMTDYYKQLVPMGVDKEVEKKEKQSVVYLGGKGPDGSAITPAIIQTVRLQADSKLRLFIITRPRMLILKGSTDEETQEWEAAIKQAIEELKLGILTKGPRSTINDANPSLGKDSLLGIALKKELASISKDDEAEDGEDSFAPKPKAGSGSAAPDEGRQANLLKGPSKGDNGRDLEDPSASVEAGGGINVYNRSGYKIYCAFYQKEVGTSSQSTPSTSLFSTSPRPSATSCSSYYFSRLTTPVICLLNESDLFLAPLNMENRPSTVIKLVFSRTASSLPLQLSRPAYKALPRTYGGIRTGEDAVFVFSKNEQLTLYDEIQLAGTGLADVVPGVRNLLAQGEAPTSLLLSYVHPIASRPVSTTREDRSPYDLKHNNADNFTRISSKKEVDEKGHQLIDPDIADEEVFPIPLCDRLSTDPLRALNLPDKPLDIGMERESAPVLQTSDFSLPLRSKTSTKSPVNLELPSLASNRVTGARMRSIPPPSPSDRCRQPSSTILFLGEIRPVDREQPMELHSSLQGAVSGADLYVMNCEAPVCHLEQRTLLSCHRGRRKDMALDYVQKVLQEAKAKGDRTLLSLANNHVGDCYGDLGLKMTKKNLESLGIRLLGIRQLEERVLGSVAKVTLPCGSTIGIVAWTSWLNYRSKKCIPSVITERDVLNEDWKRVKRNEGIDILIGYPHWSFENALLPVQETRQVAKTLLEGGGFDLIVGHGSHTLQSMEIFSKKDALEGNVGDPSITSSEHRTSVATQRVKAHSDRKLCVYSLGDFVSDRTGLQNRMGGMLEVTVGGGKLLSYKCSPFCREEDEKTKQWRVIPLEVLKDVAGYINHHKQLSALFRLPSALLSPSSGSSKQQSTTFRIMLATEYIVTGSAPWQPTLYIQLLGSRGDGTERQVQTSYSHSYREGSGPDRGVVKRVELLLLVEKAGVGSLTEVNVRLDLPKQAIAASKGSLRLSKLRVLNMATLEWWVSTRPYWFTNAQQGQRLSLRRMEPPEAPFPTSDSLADTVG